MSISSLHCLLLRLVVDFRNKLEPSAHRRGLEFFKLTFQYLKRHGRFNRHSCPGQET